MERLNSTYPLLISDSHPPSMSAFASEVNLRLEDGCIPDDWYARLFDDTYVEIDQMRRPLDVTRAEVRWIEGLAQISRPLRILDLACGYGRHAIELAKRGHSVVGIDLSAPLLNRAELDAKRHGVRIELCHQDIRELPNEEFDVVISMHTSLGYFATRSENELLVSRISDLLSQGGVFIFDQVDLYCPTTRHEQQRESYLLKSDIIYQKISLFSESECMWYGAYLFKSRSGSSFRPFRIWIQRDSVGKIRGIYTFPHSKEAQAASRGEG